MHFYRASAANSGCHRLIPYSMAYLGFLFRYAAVGWTDGQGVGSSDA
jgi:hypothetical protein